MIKNFCILFLALSGFFSLALGAEDKNVVVDQAIGGMEQGRRISVPGNYSNTGIASANSRSVANPVTDAHAHPFMQMTGNRGYMYSNAGANGPQNASTGTSPSQAGSSILLTAQTASAGSITAETGTSQPHTGTEVTGSAAGSAQTVPQQTGGSVNAGTQAGQTVTAQVTNPSTTTQGSSGTSGTSSNPIVGVQAGTNPGSNTVHNANVTTQSVTGTTGQIVPEQTSSSVATGNENHGYITGQVVTTKTNSPTAVPTGGTQEPSGTSGTSSNPIVSVEAGTNPASGTPNTAVHVDTSGQLEDRQIVDAGVTGQAGSTQVEEGSATDVTGQELVHEADITTEAATSVTGQTTPEQISTGSGTTAQEPSGTSGNPIVAVETGTNPESGTPTVGASVDTTGELEDKQFLQTDLASEGVASPAQVGSASDITGSSAVHGADITTQPQTGSGSSGTTTQEPSGTSSNPIVGVEAGANPESGTPNVGVHVDTSGQLEDRQIVDAGVTGQAGSSGTQVGSASEITGSGTVGGLDVTTQPVESVVPAPSGMSAEVDTTGQTVGGTADVGVQADSSGVSDTSDVAKKDPADGLNLGTTVKTGL